MRQSSKRLRGEDETVIENEALEAEAEAEADTRTDR